MAGSIPNLCPHSFYMGRGCPDCTDEVILIDMMREAISRLSYVSGVLAATSNKYTQETMENMKFAEGSERFLDYMDKKAA